MARAWSLPVGLPGQLRVALHVEDVVLHLEGETDGRAELGKRGEPGGGQAAARNAPPSRRWRGSARRS